MLMESGEVKHMQLSRLEEPSSLCANKILGTNILHSIVHENIKKTEMTFALPYLIT